MDRREQMIMLPSGSERVISSSYKQPPMSAAVITYKSADKVRKITH